MKTRTIIFGGISIALILFLLRSRHETRIDVLPPEKIQGLPHLSYDIPDIIVHDAPPHPLLDFDWMGEGDCHCDGSSRIDAVIIDSITLAPRVASGYTYVPNPTLDFPDYIKGAVPLVQSPTMPNPITYRAATPSFWWGWKGMARVIYTSDGHTLSTGLKNRLYTIVAGPGIFDEITVIKYNGQNYIIDREKSVGL